VTSAAANFQGAGASVDAFVVNSRARDAMNLLPAWWRPAITASMRRNPSAISTSWRTPATSPAERHPAPIQRNSSATSFSQWKTVYSDGLTLKDRNGAALPIFLTPGNHDVGNALAGPRS